MQRHAFLSHGLHEYKTGTEPQQGVAAIEFALLVTLLLVVVFAIVSFGAMFWAQQQLSHLAADGARYALVLSMDDQGSGSGSGGASADGSGASASMETSVCSSIRKQAASYALLTASPTCGFTLDSSGDDPAQPRYATVTVSYPTAGLPLASLVGSLAGFFSANHGDWVPKILQASAKIRLVDG
jgi:Flp pilus assembly protein TadG